MTLTKFLDPKFNSPANNKNFYKNYDRVFGMTAYCIKCKTERKVKPTGKMEGMMEQAICQTCKSEVWVKTDGS